MSPLPASLPHSLQCSVTICASADTVFRYFTDNERWARWWGAGSTIDPRPGGKVSIRYPNGVEAGGEVVELHPPRRIVFTYGFASGKPVPMGASRVTITVEETPEGSHVRLQHDLADEGARDEHVQGWRYQLSVFSNVVADEANAWAERGADTWFAAWAEPDEAQRRKMFADICEPDVRVADRNSSLGSLEDLVAHSGAAQRFMPGVKLTRRGPALHCQGAALVDWVATGSDGAELLSGANAFTCSARNRFAAVTGFTRPRTP